MEKVDPTSTSSQSLPEDWTNRDLLNDRNAVWAMKRRGAVWVEFAVRDGTLQTLEGPVRYRAGDALITRSDQDRWPVAQHKFPLRYEADGPSSAPADGRYLSKPQRVRARRMDAAFSVQVGAHGDVLHGSPGDWLLQYGPNDYGIVQATVFVETYALEAPSGAPIDGRSTP